MSTKKSNPTHYDTLGLKQTCTEQEVKDAFLKLSKAHHPDLNPNDPKHQDKFVQVYEAYSVLSKPGKRVAYDSNLRFLERAGQQHWNGIQTDAPHYTTWRDESLWSHRSKTSDNYDPNKGYYGIKGVNKVSNYWIAGGAIGVMLLGSLLHFIAFKHSSVFTVKQLDNRDERIARDLYRVRQTAQRLGKDGQISYLQERFGWTDDNTSENGNGNGTKG